MTNGKNTIISKERLDLIDSKNIYFAHMSVGGNIIEGIKELTGDQMPIYELGNGILPETPAFIHSKIGENYKPLLKLDDFSGKLKQENLGNRLDAALLKFCYVDIDEKTDVEKLFTIYKSTFDSLEKEYPGIKFIHITNPLMAQQRGIKSLVKKIIGRPVYGYEDNLKRQDFNELMRKNYPLLFDLARIESTAPDGKRMEHEINGEVYYSLYPGYTDDGGHLNETGRKFVAAELMNFLSEEI